jgi:hypothetical protein
MKMAIYPQYQTVAFNLDWNELKKHKLFKFVLPPESKQRINKEFNDDASDRGIPSKSLCMALSIKFPQILSFNRWGTDPWFYCTKPLNMDELTEVFSEWINVELEKENPELLDAFRSGVFTEIGMEPSIANEIYGCIPNLIANNLHFKELIVEGNKVRFHRIIGDQPAELISWPPLGNKKKYSFMLTVRVHEIPQRKEKVVHIRLGVKRFANNNRLKIAKTTFFGLKPKRCTVLFASTEQEDFIFGEATLLKSRDRENPLPTWEDRPKELFESLHFRTFPDPDDARKLSGLENFSDWVTAIVFHVQMNLKRYPATGTAAPEKYAFMQEIASEIRTLGFIPENPLKKLDLIDLPEIGASSNSFPFQLRFYLRNRNPMLEELIERAIIDMNPSVNIQNAVIFEQPNADLIDSLNLEEITDREQRLRTHFDRIHATNTPQIIFYDLINYREDDDDNVTESPDDSEELEVIPNNDPRAFIRKVILKYPWGIQQFDSSKFDFTDPERKDGQTDEEYEDSVNKHKQSLEKKMLNIIAAGMLNFGYNWKKWDFEYEIPVNLSSELITNFRMAEFNEKLQYIPRIHNYKWIGLFFQKTRKLYQVIAVLINSTGETLASVNNLTDFRPFNEVHTQSVTNLRTELTVENLVTRFFELLRFIQSDSQSQYIMVINAKNEGIRNVLPFLTNKVEIDTISSEFKERPNTRDVLKKKYNPDDIPNLNIIRIRTSENLETPEIFGYRRNSEGEIKIGYSPGISESMKIEEQSDPTAELRVIYSIGVKSMMHQFAKGISRFETSSIPLWNPNSIEFYLQFKAPSQNALIILSLCHHLRQISPHFDEYTRMPYPIILAEELAEKIEDTLVNVREMGD